MSLKKNVFQNLLPRDGEVIYEPHFLASNEASNLFEILERGIAWKQEPVVMFGRKIMQPRLTAWYGDAGKNYTYAGVTMNPLLWTEELHALKGRIEAFAESAFTSVLLNFYRNERDSMGWHRDNEKELGPEPVIASLSLGAARDFLFRHRTTKEKVSVTLGHGSLLIMRGATQDRWDHALPKRARSLAPRINLTFRKIVG